jgi:hypothetical protein
MYIVSHALRFDLMLRAAVFAYGGFSM